jgi:hypothetical protein
MKCSLCDDDFSKELEQKMEECLSVPDPIPPHTEEDEKFDLEGWYETWQSIGQPSPRAALKLIRLAAGYMAERDTARADAGCIAKYRDQYFRELDEARAVLREYGRHQGRCFDHARKLNCKCGLDELLGESTDAEKPEAPESEGSCPNGSSNEASERSPSGPS